MGRLKQAGRQIESAAMGGRPRHALTEMGRYSEALGDCDWAEPILAEHFGDGSFEVATCRNQRAYTYARIGLFSDAIANWTRAVRFSSDTARGRERPWPGCHGGAHASLGQYGKAEAACRQAIDDLREEGRDVDVARIRINLGNMLIRMGRSVEALEQYALAERAFLRSGLEVELAECRSRKSFAYCTIGNYENALAECDRAEPGLSGVALARGRLYRAMALRGMGRHDESITIYENIEEMFSKSSEEERQRYYVGFGDASGMPAGATRHSDATPRRVSYSDGRDGWPGSMWTVRNSSQRG